jgi:hypothetical protein
MFDWGSLSQMAARTTIQKDDVMHGGCLSLCPCQCLQGPWKGYESNVCLEDFEPRWLQEQQGKKTKKTEQNIIKPNKTYFYWKF